MLRRVINITAPVENKDLLHLFDYKEPAIAVKEEKYLEFYNKTPTEQINAMIERAKGILKVQREGEPRFSSIQYDFLGREYMIQGRYHAIRQDEADYIERSIINFSKEFPNARFIPGTVAVLTSIADMKSLELLTTQFQKECSQLMESELRLARLTRDELKEFSASEFIKYNLRTCLEEYYLITLHNRAKEACIAGQETEFFKRYQPRVVTNICYVVEKNRDDEFICKKYSKKAPHYELGRYTQNAEAYFNAPVVWSPGPAESPYFDIGKPTAGRISICREEVDKALMSDSKLSTTDELAPLYWIADYVKFTSNYKPSIGWTVLINAIAEPILLKQPLPKTKFSSVYAVELFHNNLLLPNLDLVVVPPAIYKKGELIITAVVVEEPKTKIKGTKRKPTDIAAEVSKKNKPESLSLVSNIDFLDETEDKTPESAGSSSLESTHMSRKKNISDRFQLTMATLSTADLTLVITLMEKFLKEEWITDSQNIVGIKKTENLFKKKSARLEAQEASYFLIKGSGKTLSKVGSLLNFTMHELPEVKCSAEGKDECAPHAISKFDFKDCSTLGYRIRGINKSEYAVQIGFIDEETNQITPESSEAAYLFIKELKEGAERVLEINRQHELAELSTTTIVPAVLTAEWKTSIAKRMYLLLDTLSWDERGALQILVRKLNKFPADSALPHIFALSIDRLVLTKEKKALTKMLNATGEFKNVCAFEIINFKKNIDGNLENIPYLICRFVDEKEAKLSLSSKQMEYILALLSTDLKAKLFSLNISSPHFKTEDEAKMTITVKNLLQEMSYENLKYLSSVLIRLQRYPLEVSDGFWGWPLNGISKGHYAYFNKLFHSANENEQSFSSISPSEKIDTFSFEVKKVGLFKGFFCIYGGVGTDKTVKTVASSQYAAHCFQTLYREIDEVILRKKRTKIDVTQTPSLTLFAAAAAQELKVLGKTKLSSSSSSSSSSSEVKPFSISRPWLTLSEIEKQSLSTQAETIIERISDPMIFEKFTRALGRIKIDDWEMGPDGCLGIKKLLTKEKKKPKVEASNFITNSFKHKKHGLIAVCEELGFTLTEAKADLLVSDVPKTTPFTFFSYTLNQIAKDKFWILLGITRGVDEKITAQSLQRAFFFLTFLKDIIIKKQAKLAAAVPVAEMKDKSSLDDVVRLFLQKEIEDIIARLSFDDKLNLRLLVTKLSGHAKPLMDENGLLSYKFATRTPAANLNNEFCRILKCIKILNPRISTQITRAKDKSFYVLSIGWASQKIEMTQDATLKMDFIFTLLKTVLMRSISYPEPITNHLDLPQKMLSRSKAHEILAGFDDEALTIVSKIFSRLEAFAYTRSSQDFLGWTLENVKNHSKYSSLFVDDQRRGSGYYFSNTKLSPLNNMFSYVIQNDDKSEGNTHMAVFGGPNFDKTMQTVASSEDAFYFLYELCSQIGSIVNSRRHAIEHEIIASHLESRSSESSSSQHSAAGSSGTLATSSVMFKPASNVAIGVADSATSVQLSTLSSTNF